MIIRKRGSSDASSDGQQERTRGISENENQQSSKELMRSNSREEAQRSKTWDTRDSSPVVQSTEEKEKPVKVIERLPKEQREARGPPPPPPPMDRTENTEDDARASDRHKVSSQETVMTQSIPQESAPVQSSSSKNEVMQTKEVEQTERHQEDSHHQEQQRRKDDNNTSSSLVEKDPEVTKVEETVKPEPVSQSKPPERGKRRPMGEGVKQIRDLSQSKESPSASKELQNKKEDTREEVTLESQPKPASPWKIPNQPVTKGETPQNQPKRSHKKTFQRRRKQS